MRLECDPDANNKAMWVFFLFTSQFLVVICLDESVNGGRFGGWKDEFDLKPHPSQDCFKHIPI